jgi:hypothetical protein
MKRPAESARNVASAGSVRSPRVSQTPRVRMPQKVRRDDVFVQVAVALGAQLELEADLDHVDLGVPPGRDVRMLS